MVKSKSRVARYGDIAPIAANMRQADITELAAAHGLSVDMRALLEESWRSASAAWTFTVHSEPVAMMGVSPVGEGRVGAPWLLSSERVARLSPRQVLEYTKRYMPDVLRDYELLANYVHVDNEVSIGWLRHAGFTVAKSPTPWGKYGEPFLLFCIRGDLYQCASQ